MSTTHGTSVSTAPPDAAPPGGEIVARAGRYYRNARYVMALVMIGVGPWFAYDGWVKYPRQNQDAIARGGSKPPHSDTDLLIQRAIACTLPPLGFALLGWALYNSRGAYRLRDDVLSVPGHPAVPLDAIRQIDKTKWDRKGIAYIDYELPDGTGRIKLDDFVYEAQPTRDILARIEERVLPPEESGSGGEVTDRDVTG